jgi:hypothetical protein
LGKIMRASASTLVVVLVLAGVVGQEGVLDAKSYVQQLERNLP